MPKPHRGATTGLLRSHSRTSSNSKLGTNLQFTQKEQPPLKVVDKSKRNAYGHDVNPTHGKGIARVASGQRVHSRDQIQPHAPKHALPPQNLNTSTRNKPDFTIASPGEEDEDEWISSESGAVTPGDDLSGSESTSDGNTPDEELINRLAGGLSPQTVQPTNGTRSGTPVLTRTETARPSDFPPTATPIKTTPYPHILSTQIHQPSNLDTVSAVRASSPIHPSPKLANKRQSTTRPPSTHSIRGETQLRPHPLIRGHSYGQAYPAKPAPLEPLTVIQDAETSTSPPANTFENGQLSTSPSSSIKTTLSPASPNRGSSPQHRRTSVSSTRSVATLPIQPHLRDSVNWSLHDRKRTMSTISHSSSSAALSSLAHLPTVTRPPSPQAVSFFPPVNPHSNIEGIHPLLPGPYLNNHLTVLARRTPIKESFDRVIRAKQLRT